MGMLLHRHYVENAKIATQEGRKAPSEAVKDNPVIPEEKPVETPSKPVKRGGRGRGK